MKVLVLEYVGLVSGVEVEGWHKVKHASNPRKDAPIERGLSDMNRTAIPSLRRMSDVVPSRTKSPFGP